MLTILLLGSPQLNINGEPIPGLRRKNRALLYYLAGCDSSLTRDHLLAFFYPDHDRASAQQILRTMLYDLRQKLGDALLVEDDRLSLSSETAVDVRDFTAGVSTKASVEVLSKRLELYRGDFLAGFSIPDSPPFEDWVAAQRDRYRALALQCVAALGQRHEAARNYDEALKTLNRGLGLDPLQEELQSAAIRLHYLRGDRASAIRRYDALCKLLDQEMGVPPMPATRALYDAIINDTLPVPNQAVSRVQGSPQYPLQSPQRQGMASAFLPFTGRSAELSELAALSSSGKLIVLEGEPGIGKTRLAEEFITTQGQSAPPLVLRSAAHELEQRLPYQPIIDALRHLLDSAEWPELQAVLDLSVAWQIEVGRLIPELAPAGAPASLPVVDESRLWEGITQLLVALSRQRPLIVFVDDLQWADPSTVTFLGYLVRRTATAALTVLATTHPPLPRSTLAVLLEALVHEGRLAHLALTSLSADDTAALAHRFSPAYSDSLSNWLTRNAEGNPYFLTELIRYAYHNDFLKEDGALDVQALSSTPILPQSVHNLVRSRFSRLSDNTRRVLDIAAVTGQEFDVEIVIGASGIGDGAVLDSLDELRIAGLTLPYDGARYSFDHSLTKEVACREMGQARYRMLHRRVAETIEALHPNRLDSFAVLLASHFAEGNVPLRAAQYAFRAGQLAAKMVAWTEAIALYEQALSADIEGSERAAVLIALGDAHFQYGQFAEASDAFRSATREAARVNDNPLLERAHLALNQSFYPQARYQEAVTLAEELRASGPPELAASAEFMWGTALSLEGRYPALAGEHLNEAERLLKPGQDQNILLTTAKVKYQQAGVFGQQGDFKTAVMLYREALALAAQDETVLDLQRHILAYNNLAYYLHLLNDPAAAEAARTGLALAQQNGSLSHQPYLYSTLGEIALAHDEVDIAEQYFSEGLGLAERLSLPERIAGLTANLGLAARQRGQFELAGERFRQALTQADAIGAQNLAVRIRIWLAPFLPHHEARQMLHEARAVAESGGHHGLLGDIDSLEQQLTDA